MTRIVAWYEFLFTVKRPAYLIVTFGLPVFIGLYAGFIMLVSLGTASYVIEGLSAKVGVVDDTGLLEYARQYEAELKKEKESSASGDSDIASAARQLEAMFEKIQPDESRTFPTIDAAKAALESRQIDVVIHVPADYVREGVIETYLREWKIFGAIAAPQQVRQRLRLGLLQRAGLSDAEMTVIRGGGENSNGFGSVTLHELGADGKFVEVNQLQRIMGFAVPAGVAGLLILALMLNAGFLVAGVAEEKENKVIEVLLSMVRVDQLLMGKVLGLSGAALAQMFVWAAMAAPIPLIVGAVGGRAIGFEWNFGVLSASGLFFMLGFVFYGALLVGLGSLGNNIKESQQYSMYIMLLPVVPMIMVVALVNAPNGLLSRALGWIPFFSPPAMMIRLATGEVPIWDVAISAAILVASTWGAVRFSARLFRVGALLRGQSMNPIRIARLFLQA
ncbi:MAG: ABC transporter permease [Phycisphaerales bacterium]|nr:ABC transporter permease [Phycisphaerales bacterium]MCB9854732.1 ABC transporter permease [Phycisphaerales bacterium]